MSDSNESHLENNVSSETSSNENNIDSPKKKSKVGKIYKQFYRKAWEEVPEFKEWLTSIPGERSLAYCKICQKTLHTHRLSLTKHTVSLKHTRLAQRRANEEREVEELVETLCGPEELSEKTDVQILMDPKSGLRYAIMEQAGNITSDERVPSETPNETVQENNLPSDVASAIVGKEDSQPRVNETSQPQSQQQYQRRHLADKPPITTHVLDISKGVPAAGLAVSLYQLIDGRWTLVKDGHTNGDGRCNTLTTAGSVKPGRYKLHFDTDRYFVLHRQATFFPFIEVVFDVCSPEEKNHVPVLLSPYGYSIYKGS